MDLSRKNITELARELRKTPTPSEKLFWELVRKRRFKGLRFIRQKPFVTHSTELKDTFISLTFIVQNIS